MKNGRWELVRDEIKEVCKDLIEENLVRYAEKFELCINKTMGSPYQVLNIRVA